MSANLATMPQDPPADPPAGGDEDEDQNLDPDGQPNADQIDGEDEDDVEDPDGAENLGDPGKKALDRMKAAVKDGRRQNRELQKQLDELRREKEAADKTPDEQALDKVRAEARAEATEKANARIIRSEVRAAAAGKFKDPSDALAFLDLTELEVDENGDVDADEVADALADLLQRKPHLAAQSGPTSFDSARGKPTPKKLTRDDLKKMTPEQIDKAHREGRIEA